jgi:hypothetical protein
MLIAKRGLKAIMAELECYSFEITPFGIANRDLSSGLAVMMDVFNDAVAHKNLS